jgi:sugar phosphate isomerase/epimerase
VRLIGKEYLAVLHVHDNNGRSDLHWNPYTGVIDWDDFSAALREIDFAGTVSLETAVPGRIPQDIREPFEQGLFRMAQRIAGR